MAISCFKCKRAAVTFIRYNGTHLCTNHFIEYVEKRVKQEIKKQGKTPSHTTLGIAASGGKDSSVLLYLMHKIFSHRPNISLHAITVDEGINGYRNKCIKKVQHLCVELDIPHSIIRFKDNIGTSMDDIAKRQYELGECTFCGVFRRFCLNIETKKLAVHKLATGHNLDDTAQSILMNFINGDINKLTRLGPHKKIQPGLIPRIMPLRMIPEKEVMLYALLQNIDFHHAECPYTLRASRQYYRDILDQLESTNPGTKYSILNSYEKIKDILPLYSFTEIQKCQKCGEPTSQQICKACILKEKIITN